MILGIETATDVCSVALLHDDALLAEINLFRPRAHAENLAPMVQDVLRYGQADAAALRAVAVSKGPGSYTGLRIGVATAKGLAFATGAALIGVPSLEALAASAAHRASPGDWIGAAFHSRRNEIYAGLFRIGADGLPEMNAPVATYHTDEALPGGLIEGMEEVTVCGEASAAFATMLEGSGVKVRTLGPADVFPRAASVARLALPRLRAGRTEPLSSFEPYYLNEFVAKKPAGTPFDRLPF